MDNFSERNAQYLSILTAKKQKILEQIKDYEKKTAKLRKSPSQTNVDLQIYQYNVKIEQLKGELSSIDKEISQAPNQTLSAPTPAKNYRSKPEMVNDFQASPQQEEIVQTEKLSFGKKTKIIFAGFKDLKSNALLVALALVTAFVMFVFDRLNFLSFVSNHSIIKIPLMLVMFCTVVILTAYYSFRNISTNAPGTIADYLAFYFALVSIADLVIFFFEMTIFKGAIFVALALYCVVYGVLRIHLYQNPYTPKFKIEKYYAALFNKFPLLLVMFIFLTLAVLSYLAFYSRIPEYFYSNPVTKKYAMAILTVLGVIALVYLGLSAFNLNQKSIFISDLISLLLVEFGVCFFVLYLLSHGKTLNEYLIANSLILATGLLCSVYRIIIFKENV